MLGSERGARPPDTPRTIPGHYPKRARKNDSAYWFGFVFTVFFFWSGIFLLIGLPLLLFGLSRVRGKLRALRQGVVAEGEVVEVRRGGTSRGDGSHDWAVEYRFDGPDGPLQGRVTTSTSTTTGAAPGVSLEAVPHGHRLAVVLLLLRRRVRVVAALSADLPTDPAQEDSHRAAKARRPGEGGPARGEVVEVQEIRTGFDNKPRIHWGVRYVFDGPDGVAEGMSETHEPAYSRFSPGDAVWVVYDPEDPAGNDLWPPLP